MLTRDNDNNQLGHIFIFLLPIFLLLGNLLSSIILPYLKMALVSKKILNMNLIFLGICIGCFPLIALISSILLKGIAYIIVSFAISSLEVFLMGQIVIICNVYKTGLNTYYWICAGISGIFLGIVRVLSMAFPLPSTKYDTDQSEIYNEQVELFQGQNFNNSSINKFLEQLQK